MLDGPITAAEVVSAIARLKLNKAPGPDDFTALFYSTFCDTLAPILADLLNSFPERGAVTPSMLQATISVILKPSKDPRLCSSYRPISVLSMDASYLLLFWQLGSNCICKASLTLTNRDLFLKGDAQITPED